MNLLQVAGERDDVRAVYQALSRVEYSWEELTSRPLPPGVDPARIELYLSDSAFQVRQSDLNAGSPQMQGFGSGIRIQVLETRFKMLNHHKIILLLITLPITFS